PIDAIPGAGAVSQAHDLAPVVDSVGIFQNPARVSGYETVQVIFLSVLPQGCSVGTVLDNAARAPPADILPAGVVRAYAVIAVAGQGVGRPFLNGVHRVPLQVAAHPDDRVAVIDIRRRVSIDAIRGRPEFHPSSVLDQADAHHPLVERIYPSRSHPAGDDTA